MTAGAAIATHGIRSRYPAGAARPLGAAATARATGTASTARLTRGGRIRARGACNTCTAIAAETARSTVAIKTGNTACTASRTGVTPQATAAAERAGFSILTRRGASSAGVANATRAARAAVTAVATGATPRAAATASTTVATDKTCGDGIEPSAAVAAVAAVGRSAVGACDRTRSTQARSPRGAAITTGAAIGIDACRAGHTVTASPACARITAVAAKTRRGRAAAGTAGTTRAACATSTAVLTGGPGRRAVSAGVPTPAITARAAIAACGIGARSGAFATRRAT